jgi:hypothetical protein
LGLAVRKVWIDSFSIVADLGYGYSRLPVVEAKAASTSASQLDFHGPWAALSLGLEGRWAPRLRASGTPVAFGQSFAGSSRGWQLAAGCELGVGIFDLGPTRWSLVAAYDYSLTRFAGVDQDLDERAHLVSIALRSAALADKKRVDLPPPTGPGSLRGLAVFDEDGKPAAGVTVEVAGTGPVLTDAEGAFAVARAGPGPVTLHAEVPGYRLLDRTVEIPPEEEASTELRLVRRSGPGSLRGTVVSMRSGQPQTRTAVAGAIVELTSGAASVECASDGTFLLQSVGPGPVELKIAAPGYQPGEEVVVVAPETEAQAEIVLIRLKAKAVVRGLVRSPDGEPLEAKVQYTSTARGRGAAGRGVARSNAKGEFLFEVPSGAYRLTINVPGYLSQTKTIEVGEGDQAIFNVDMHPYKAQPRKR